MATVWATLGKIWATFISNIWSHWYCGSDIYLPKPALNNIPSLCVYYNLYGCSPVFCHGRAQNFGHRDWPPHEGNRKEENDSGYVEEQVAQRDLNRCYKTVLPVICNSGGTVINFFRAGALV